MAKFKNAAAAGTFDRLHKGHEAFLLGAFSVSEKVHIAITSDSFAQSKRANESFKKTILPFAKRKVEIEAFLKKHTLSARATFIELADVFGPTLDESFVLDALIVTERTQGGADIVNKARGEKQLAPLAIEVIPLELAYDGKPIASERIRAGEIDRLGNATIPPPWFERNFILPDHLRPLLQKPMGQLIHGREEYLEDAITICMDHMRKEVPFRIITVGDIVTSSFNKAGVAIDLAIIDFKVKRKEKFSTLKDLGFVQSRPNMTVENPTGMLTGKAMKAVANAKFPAVIQVMGEEDLLALPAVLAAPLRSFVYYGQPNEGIVLFEVTEEKKAEIKELISQFDKV
jgi:GTP-dependent dephospho-CoA kinase